MTKFEIWLGCLVLGHQLYVIKRLSDGSRKIGCNRCEKMWAMNDRCQAFLPWDDVLLDKRTVRVRGGKTAAAKRDVPLSAEAMRILNQLSGNRLQLPVFGLTTPQIDALFRKAKAKALVSGLTFHDMRHTAITRLARKLDVLSLARMVGHRDLRMLQIYFNPSAEDLADRLG